jgi:hypothetical protein
VELVHVHEGGQAIAIRRRSRTADAVEAREAYSAQLERIRELEAEILRLKDWSVEKQCYELRSVGAGSVAYMLKPDNRGTRPPYWLCPTCFERGKKEFLAPTGATLPRGQMYKCTGCGGQPVCLGPPKWIDQ